MPRNARLSNPRMLFTVTATAIVALIAVLLRTQQFSHNFEVVAWGATLDLTITIPAIYYLVVVRSGQARPLSIAPVFVICAAVAAAIVPRGDQALLHQLRILAMPLDIVTIALVVRRIAQTRRDSARGDAETRIRTASASLFGPTVGTVVASEITVLWYALFCWRKRPDVPFGAQALTVHERSGWGSVVTGVVVLIVSESIGAHLLLQLWSTKVAWIVTGLDVYGVLWLIGDYQALRLRPTLIHGESLDVRHGLRWRATIDRQNVESIEPVRSESEWKRRRTLRLALLDEPRYVIRLRTPVVAIGIAGIRKTIDSVALLPDDAPAFEALWR